MIAPCPQSGASRERIDPRAWPLIILGAMMSLGCTVAFNNFDARIINESSRPISIEYSGDTDGRDVERWSTQLAPGGEFERHLQGRIVHAQATIQNPDPTKEPLVIEFAQGWSEFTVKDRGAGISLDQRSPRPKEPK